MRAPGLLSLLALLLLSGCLDPEGPIRDAGADGAASGADGPDAVVLVHEEMGAGSGYFHTPSSCVLGLETEDYTMLERKDARLDGHAYLNVSWYVGGPTPELQFGHSVDDGPIEWSEEFAEGTLHLRIDLGDVRWEEAEARWHFWVRYAPPNSEACNTGVSQGPWDILVTAHP